MQNCGFLQALCRSATDGILITDASGKIVLSNPAALRLLGYEDTELGGQPLPMLLARGKNSSTIRAFAKATRSVVTGKKGTVCLIKKDGTFFPVRLIISRILDTQPYYATIIQALNPAGTPGDLTATVAALETSRTAISESLNWAREESQTKSRFVALASHEFRTPLSSIQLSASVIEHYFDRLDRDKYSGTLHKIVSAVPDMTGTLNDLLSLEKIESGHLAVHQRPLNLAAFCGTVAKELQQHLKPGQGIQCAGYPGTGLGLSIVKKCSELLRGSIAHQSVPGSGTSFTLTFLLKNELNKQKMTAVITRSDPYHWPNGGLRRPWLTETSKN